MRESLYAGDVRGDARTVWRVHVWRHDQRCGEQEYGAALAGCRYARCCTLDGVVGVAPNAANPEHCL